MNLLRPKVFTVDQVEPGLVINFLCKVYRPLKSTFLLEHGEWWHRSNSNRLVIQLDNKIVGYCAVIPTKLWMAGKIQPALWKVDLIIDPEYRGRGLQKLFDDRVREMTNLLLGFPNAGLSSRIHRKLGWSVREDSRILMLPLRPFLSKTVQNTQGLRGTILRSGALALTPISAVWRSRLMSQRLQNVWKMKQLDAEILSEIFLRTKSNMITTTWRDESFFEWRYGLAPQPEEFSYFLAGSSEAPSHFLIARHLSQREGIQYTRILDVFGDFNDVGTLRDLITLAVRDAIANDSGQITILASSTNLRVVAQRLGFILSAPMNFCWISETPEIMFSLAGENYWTLADSDNDLPE